MNFVFRNIDEQNQYLCAKDLQNEIMKFATREKNLKKIANNTNLGDIAERQKKATNYLFETVNGSSDVTQLSKVLNNALSNTDTFFGNSFNQNLQDYKKPIANFCEKFQQYKISWEKNRDSSNVSVIEWLQEGLKLSWNNLKTKIVTRTREITGEQRDYTLSPERLAEINQNKDVQQANVQRQNMVENLKKELVEKFNTSFNKLDENIENLKNSMRQISIKNNENKDLLRELMAEKLANSNDYKNSLGMNSN